MPHNLASSVAQRRGQQSPCPWSGLPAVLPHWDSMIMDGSAGQSIGCTQRTDGLDSAPSVYFQCKELSLRYFTFTSITLYSFSPSGKRL